MLRKKRRSRITQLKLAVEHTGFYPYLQQFWQWQTVKGYSRETVTRKDSALRQFIVWCDERGLEDPRAITKPMVERYQRHLFYRRKANGEPLAITSQMTLFAAVKTWFKWLTRENYLASNPASEVEPIKAVKRLPARVLSRDEVRSILESINTQRLQGIRERTILEVLYSTGIRRAELCGLRVGDVDPHRQSVFVRLGKGGKDRYTPIGRQALLWLARYQQEVRPQLVLRLQEQRLFLTDYGEAYTPNRLGHLVRRLLSQAGYEAGGCHVFRHAMATHMLDNGAELRYIQAILGHADINTTTIYTHLSVDKLRQVHALTHPAEALQDSLL